MTGQVPRIPPDREARLWLEARHGKAPGRRSHQRARRRARSPCRNTGSKGRVRTPEFGWHHEVFETLSSQSQGTGARFCPPLPFPAGEEVQHQQGPQAEAPEEAFLPASGPR